MRAVVLILLVACADSDPKEPVDPIDGDCIQGEHCLMESATCQIEGHAACNVEPVSGGCTCRSGVWECFTSCPAECPRLQKPTEGSACNLPPSVMCPYEEPPYGPDRVYCTCTSSGFACN
jgi:hypothetical protein